MHIPIAKFFWDMQISSSFWNFWRVFVIIKFIIIRVRYNAVFGQRSLEGFTNSWLGFRSIHFTRPNCRNYLFHSFSFPFLEPEYMCAKIKMPISSNKLSHLLKQSAHLNRIQELLASKLNINTDSSWTPYDYRTKSRAEHISMSIIRTYLLTSNLIIVRRISFVDVQSLEQLHPGWRPFIITTHTPLVWTGLL